MGKVKEFVENNKGKIIVGITAVAAFVAYALYSESKYDELKENHENLKIDVKSLTYENDELRYDKDTMMSASSEGLFEEAIATVTRKLNTVTDRIKYNEERLKEYPDDYQTAKSLEDYTSRYSVLTSRRERFLNAQRVYEINCEE